MTDLADREISEEIPPDVPGGSLAHIGEVTCRYCTETFALGAGGTLARGRHEKKEHPDEWKANRNPRQKAERKPPGQSAQDRIARAKAPSAKKAPSTRTPSATPSAPGGRRASAAGLLTMAAGALSYMIGSQASKLPAAGPVATMLSFESPILGIEGDAAAAGTALDRIILQPALAMEDRFERVGPLLVAPMLVGIAATVPEAWGEIQPMLRACLKPMLPALLAEMKRQQREAEQLQAQADELAELDPAFRELFAGGGDPIDAILSRIFPQPPPTRTG